jgi:hypothetical protein
MNQEDGVADPKTADRSALPPPASANIPKATATRTKMPKTRLISTLLRLGCVPSLALLSGLRLPNDFLHP